MHAHILILIIAIATAGGITCFVILERRRHLHEFPTPEYKVRVQLEQIYDHYVAGRDTLQKRHLYYCFKRLKIILVVYMKERFNITVKTVLTDSMQKKMKNATETEKVFIGSIFDRLHKFDLSTDGYAEIDKLFLDSLAFFKNRNKESLEADNSGNPTGV